MSGRDGKFATVCIRFSCIFLHFANQIFEVNELDDIGTLIRRTLGSHDIQVPHRYEKTPAKVRYGYIASIYASGGHLSGSWKKACNQTKKS
jgi:hypothetical protein